MNELTFSFICPDCGGELVEHTREDEDGRILSLWHCEGCLEVFDLGDLIVDDDRSNR